MKVRRRVALGALLKRWRESIGLTQAEAAFRASVAQTTWSRWESGALLPGLSNVSRIASLTEGHLTLEQMVEAISVPDRKAS